jgi:hypothetical protein
MHSNSRTFYFKCSHLHALVLLAVQSTKNRRFSFMQTLVRVSGFYITADMPLETNFYAGVSLNEKLAIGTLLCVTGIERT